MPIEGSRGELEASPDSSGYCKACGKGPNSERETRRKALNHPPAPPPPGNSWTGSSTVRRYAAKDKQRAQARQGRSTDVYCNTNAPPSYSEHAEPAVSSTSSFFTRTTLGPGLIGGPGAARAAHTHLYCIGYKATFSQLSKKRLSTNRDGKASRGGSQVGMSRARESRKCVNQWMGGKSQKDAGGGGGMGGGGAM